MKKQIRGVLTAVVTPFDPSGEVCPQRLRAQVRRQVKYDNGVFCNGTNGEFFVLSLNEKRLVTETCVEEVAGKVPVVAHIGEISTATTIRLGKDVAAMGVDAVSVITPYFVPLKQSELIAHYRAIADAVPVPVFLYNIPGRTGNTIEPATAAILADHPNIVGIKDSAGSYESLKGFLDAVKGRTDFDVLSGPDHLAHQGFLEGCSACISGLANVSPEGVSLIWKNFRDGNIEKSKAAQDFISGLRKDLYAVAFAPAAVKKAALLLGEDVGDSRYPIVFSDEDLATIRQVVAKYGTVPAL
ncbi:dihydrodipicolinate synthase family protein [Propionivibrio dicarboxylicus]|uniref:4-hydroxy-tetrahydrodipicolinate synthase n=1 Tax=Propionivibrio dicarboxylicus TaxID=83767 RepID=A0A1G8M6Z7_9RHOO|nr:dihydrodipicolinate synthase family protein [Propionivibrio dicarboxylicus]SDI63704.1 4-hydroxy-tetrahydrodipicolinate synthase [Propionivibrio dicarboxylicus]